MNLSQLRKNPWFTAFLVGLVLRMLLPWFSHGFRYMDEHWQVMEPANYLVHGIWSKTWEWFEGQRSWIYPWMVSLLLRTAEGIGFQDPVWIAAFVRMCHGIVAALSIPLTFAVTEKLGNRKAALWAAWVVAVWPYALFVSFHTHGEMLGALFVLAGMAFPALLSAQSGGTQPKAEAKAYLLSGVSFSIALMLKIDVAVAGAAFGLWQLLYGVFTKDLKGGLRRAVYLALGVAPLTFVVGLVDYLTWGRWFENVLDHAHMNLVEEIGNTWGVSPWYMHTVYFYNIVGIPLFVATLLLPKVWKKLPEGTKAMWFMNIVFVAVYSFVEHKEKRFMAPLIYTGLVASFATFACAPKVFWDHLNPLLLFQHLFRAGNLRRAAWTTLAFLSWLIFAVHFLADIDNSLVRRPWWDRIWAMQQAGKIPGIQKMFAPQWPAIFYLPRHVPSDAQSGEPEYLKKATQDLDHIGVAVDWPDGPKLFEEFGFQCQPWPRPRNDSGGPVPWPYECRRHRTQN